jgi:NADH-quinone oxidoreductase subunit J
MGDCRRKTMVGMMFFGGFAFLLVCAAIGVITARNPVYSAMFLVLAFVTSSALWLLLEAEFLAMTLVLVYVGAVMVLFLFVVMMLDVEVSSAKASFTRYAPLGFLVAGITFVEIFVVVWMRNQGFPVLENPVPHDADFSDTKELGAILYTEYVYPFELAAFILLLAIVAAIVLTMRRRPGLKVQNIAAQVAVRREDRVRLVKMEAEKD